MPPKNAPARGPRSVPVDEDQPPQEFIDATVTFLAEWREYWLRRTVETPDHPDVIEFWRIIRAQPIAHATHAA